MKKLGKQTIKFDVPPSIVSVASIVGPKEANGPLAQYFDQCLDDEFWGEKTWEKSESKIIKETVNMAISKSGIASSDIEYCFAGDLLNQCISSSFGLRELNIPFIGIFGACSTFVEGLSLGAVFTESCAQNVICAASSHFCSAEKQFRFPLELGNQRPPTSQWTVTGAGSAILSKTGNGPYITHITSGKIVDMGIKDANNMGAAMAPAAYDTIQAHFRDTGRRPSDYDLIVTGDLGSLGKEILLDLFHRDGIEFKNLEDCGVLIYDAQTQDVHCGGSGCGCSAAVLTGFLLNGMKQGRWRRLLFCGTGALLSPTSTLQGESIPSICHAVAISTEQ